MGYITDWWEDLTAGSSMHWEHAAEIFTAPHICGMGNKGGMTALIWLFSCFLFIDFGALAHPISIIVLSPDNFLWKCSRHLEWCLPGDSEFS